MNIYVVLDHDWDEVFSKVVKAFRTKPEADTFLEDCGGDYALDGHYYVQEVELVDV